MRLIRLLSRLGVARGFLGGSRAWSTVASFTLGVRVLKKLLGAGPQTAYREELGPGDCLVIAHDRDARVVRAPS